MILIVYLDNECLICVNNCIMLEAIKTSLACFWISKASFNWNILVNRSIDNLNKTVDQKMHFVASFKFYSRKQFISIIYNRQLKHVIYRKATEVKIQFEYNAMKAFKICNNSTQKLTVGFFEMQISYWCDKKFIHWNHKIQKMW